MKKGFTLIELLATIVILAILAFVTVPIVNSVINTGKISALENSTTFYVKDLEKKYSEWVIEGVPSDINITKTNDGYDIFSVSELNSVLDLDGMVPISGTLKVRNNYNDNDYGNVIFASIEYDEYIVVYTYDGKKANTKVNKK